MDTMTADLSSSTSFAGSRVAALRGTADAVMRANHIWTAGCHSIGYMMIGAAQDQVGRSMSLWMSLGRATSIKDAVDLHRGFARSSVAAVVAESGKLADTSVRVVTQTMAPVAARIALALGGADRPADEAGLSSPA